jgi:hypothetical protein
MENSPIMVVSSLRRAQKRKANRTMLVLVVAM